MSTQKVFVYGTLRQGQGNYPMFGNSVVRATTGCRAPGQMYYAAYEYGGRRMQMGYPVVVFTEEGEVVGDLLEVEEGPQLRAVHQMEIGAGYVLAEVPITLPDGSVEMADGYHWPEGETVGDHIESGDYLERYYLKR